MSVLQRLQRWFKQPVAAAPTTHSFEYRADINLFLFDGIEPLAFDEMYRLTSQWIDALTQCSYKHEWDMDQYSHWQRQWSYPKSSVQYSYRRYRLSEYLHQWDQQDKAYYHYQVAFVMDMYAKVAVLQDILGVSSIEGIDQQADLSVPYKSLLRHILQWHSCMSLYITHCKDKET